jgi:hypothetical protein
MILGGWNWFRIVSSGKLNINGSELSECIRRVSVKWSVVGYVAYALYRHVNKKTKKKKKRKHFVFCRIWVILHKIF